jgi:hypothetical protein
MCGCGGHGHGHCHDWGYGPGIRCGTYFGYERPFVSGPGTRDEAIDDLQEYKERLEAEIRRLEKRIGSLRPQPTSD